MEAKRRWGLYILKLESGKWYVGITSKTPEERFREHTLGKRAAYWTMKYKPLEIELEEDLGVVSKVHAEKYENRITRELMKERGLNNVRGGDLRDVEDYSAQFGWVWLRKDWELFTVALLFALSTLYLLIDKFFL